MKTSENNSRRSVGIRMMLKTSFGLRCLRIERALFWGCSFISIMPKTYLFCILCWWVLRSISTPIASIETNNIFRSVRMTRLDKCTRLSFSGACSRSLGGRHPFATPQLTTVTTKSRYSIFSKTRNKKECRGIIITPQEQR